jgi:hypothetical protein
LQGFFLEASALSATKGKNEEQLVNAKNQNYARNLAKLQQITS